jgi:hypothetical protein
MMKTKTTKMAAGEIGFPLFSVEWDEFGDIFWLALKAPRKLAGGKPQAPPPEWHPFGIRPGGAAESLRTSLSNVLSGRKPRADATGGGDRRAVLPPANFRSPSGTFPRTFPHGMIHSTENSGEPGGIFKSHSLCVSLCSFAAIQFRRSG